MQAVIFDIDGTLLRSADVDDALYRESVRSVLGNVQFRQSLADYDFVTDSGILSQVLEDNRIPGKPDYLASIKASFVEALRRHFQRHGAFAEIPGAKALLASLRNSGRHRVAIATGGWRESALLKLEHSGFDLDGVPVASSNDSHDRTQIMQIALSHLGDRFESVTYYGDGAWDRKACQTLGWQFEAVGSALGGMESFTGVVIA